MSSNEEGTREPERALQRDADELEERLERLGDRIEDAHGELAQRREDANPAEAAAGDWEEKRPADTGGEDPSAFDES